jgi:ABC-type Mn2+/Zn2+ transport system ATPase subunit
MVAAGLSTVSSSPTTSTAALRLPAGERLLHADALTVGYEGIPILPPLTLTVGAGELWAVIGPNGAGKSTFVRTALGLSHPVGGTIERRPGLRLAYVPQQSALDAIFPVSVLDFALMGLQGTDNVTLANPRAYLGRARAALAEAGVGTLERRQLRDLSGGQRQRVLMARALATDADLVFLDEPTAALDASSEQEVLDLIQRLRERRGAAVVMVTHLVEDGLERADHALLLDRDHRVAFAATAAAMRSAPDFENIYARFVGRRAQDRQETRDTRDKQEKS